MGYQLKLKMTLFFPIEVEGEANSVFVLLSLLNVIAPTNIIEIFTAQMHIESLNCFY